MANQHMATVEKNILELSVARTLSQALSEWFFTDDIIDHQKPEVSCELCEQEELRYHYQIKNKSNDNSLWVGSRCIEKFIPVFNKEGLRLTEKETRIKLKQLLKEKRRSLCLDALTDLAQKKSHKMFSDALNYFKKNKFLTPKFAAIVFLELTKNNIDYDPSFFKIYLKKKVFQKHLADMKPKDFKSIEPALTSPQKKLASKLRNPCVIREYNLYV